MTEKGIVIKLTQHAQIKVCQRAIPLDIIQKIVQTPIIIKPDKFDKSLTHFIGKIGERYLRIIGRWESKEELLVISAFFDRRLKRGEKEC